MINIVKNNKQEKDDDQDESQIKSSVNLLVSKAKKKVNI